MVLTDDMYEHIRYDGWQFATIAAVEPAVRPRADLQHLEMAANLLQPFFQMRVEDVE